MNTEASEPAVEKPSYAWARLSERELLEVRLCDLGLRIEGTPLEARIRGFYAELGAKGLHFNPPCYLTDEWFVPDGETFIGIPFFLAHPRLKRLEQKMCMEVEGGSKKEFMRLMRHEAGHAFNYAYLLHRRKRWKKLFGAFSREYSDTYSYHPYSKSYVRHLDDWYAQAHPDEDFAETFAVWLTPKRNWKKEYSRWKKALEKLEYVDSLMAETGKKKPHVSGCRPYHEISRLKSRLATYYRRKKRLNREDYPDFHDYDLRRIFAGEGPGSAGQAAGFIRAHRGDIVNEVALWTGGRKFVINRLVQDVIDRCAGLELRLAHDEPRTLLKVTAYFVNLMANYLITGSFGKKNGKKTKSACLV